MTQTVITAAAEGASGVNYELQLVCVKQSVITQVLSTVLPGRFMTVISPVTDKQTINVTDRQTKLSTYQN